jgi:hypothetical protein
MRFLLIGKSSQKLKQIKYKIKLNTYLKYSNHDIANIAGCIVFSDSSHRLCGYKQATAPSLRLLCRHSGHWPFVALSAYVAGGGVAYFAGYLDGLIRHRHHGSVGVIAI